MFAELKVDRNSELKSELKSLCDKMKNGFEGLEEKVTTLNKAVENRRLKMLKLG